MEKFKTIESKVIPLNIKNVDTDMIIPASFLTTINRTGLGIHVFDRLRKSDANFSFNNPLYSGAKILVSDENFGCGSSREHAVWALTDFGIRVVIAKSFADIFFNNSAKNGLLLIKLQDEIVDKILVNASIAEHKVKVDLENQIVTLQDGKEYHFDYDPFRKHCFLNGLDDIDYILSHKNEIDNFRKAQVSFY